MTTIDSAKDANNNVIEAPVRQVTVMEDRAQITRRARVHLEVGTHLLRVERVTPLVVDRTLRAGIEGVGGMVINVGVNRSSTIEATRPELQQQLRDKREELKKRRVTERQVLQGHEAGLASLSGTRDELMHHVARRAGRGLDQRQSWKTELDGIDRKIEESADEVRCQANLLEDLQLQLDRIGQRIAAADEPTVYYWATLRAAIEVKEAGEYEIHWEYLVPCAIWRPSHQAEIQGSQIRWQTFGTIWQNTGEPWEEAQLRLSTERPALGAEVPLLDEDLLLLRPKTDREKQYVEVTSRDDDIAVVSEGVGGGGPTASAVPGVDDGGDPRVFELPEKVTIPPDGRAHLVTIGDFSTEAKLDLVCMPEVAEMVVLRSQQRNSSRQPLLAGPVRLVRNGGFSGRSQVKFVGSQELFALGWGSMDDLQVVRRSGQHTEETTLTRRTKRKIWTEVYVSNTGQEPRQVSISERVPISEVEQVEVEMDTKETTAGWTRDDNGHLHWELTLEPGAQTELRLRYLIDAHRKVVWS